MEIIKQLLGLAKDTQANKDDIKAVQSRLETVTETLKQVIFELQRLKENEAHEREKLGLRLQNVLLRSERPLLGGVNNDHISINDIQTRIVALQ